MKPTEHLVKLIDAVSDSDRIQHGRERQIVSLQQYVEPMSFILHEGSAGVYRTSDNLLILNIKAPVIVGLNFLEKENNDFYLQARQAIRYEIVPRTLLKEKVIKNNMWESISYAYMHVAHRFLEYHFVSVGVPTYSLIRNNLIELMKENDDIRLSTNACDYVQERTLLSRSGIMKILGDLKKGGHIEIKRGVLMKIDHLPEKY
ncbi:helix-turn-helix domain-containing protein [Leminorella grimontii]|uniref:helix-turn-helix domain-containing protein n=1 Tax=Leminorella grimontii TaxID=82981 RepID=UPI0032201368